MRTPKEVDQQGMRSWYERDPETYAMPLVAWETLPTRSQSEGWRTPEPMIDAYRAMFAEGSEMIAAVLTLLATDAGMPAIIHCNSGRDRTAIVVAVLLGILGVSGEHIAEDYARSSAGMRPSLEWMRANDPVAMATIVKDEESMVYTPCATVAGL